MEIAKTLALDFCHVSAPKGATLFCIYHHSLEPNCFCEEKSYTVTVLVARMIKGAIYHCNINAVLAALNIGRLDKQGHLVYRAKGSMITDIASRLGALVWDDIDAYRTTQI